MICYHSQIATGISSNCYWVSPRVQGKSSRYSASLPSLLRPRVHFLSAHNKWASFISLTLFSPCGIYFILHLHNHFLMLCDFCHVMPLLPKMLLHNWISSHVQLLQIRNLYSLHWHLYANSTHLFCNKKGNPLVNNHVCDVVLKWLSKQHTGLDTYTALWRKTFRLHES